MKLIIDIPKEEYELVRHENKSFRTELELMNAVANGTPLPKGHGDLIDRDDLLADSYCIDDWSGNEVNIVDVMTVRMADAIIEADNGGGTE